MYVTATVANLDALFTALVNQLTTNATLVGLGQQWSNVWTAPGGSANPSAVVLRGPGASGTDNIYVGMQKVSVPGEGRYEIQFCGMTGVNAGANVLSDHINTSPLVRLFSDVVAQTYWLVASGRRFFIQTKISTVYSQAYCGFILPYALPASYPYPLFVGGSAADHVAAPVDWRSTAVQHTNFLQPYQDDSPAVASNAFLIRPDGTWNGFTGVGETAIGTNDAQMCFIHPWSYGSDFDLVVAANADSPTGRELLTIMNPCLGGTFPLFPTTIMTTNPSYSVYGAFDDVYATSGIGNSAENVITLGGEQYLVFQNCFRVTPDQYAAVRIV